MMEIIIDHHTLYKMSLLPIATMAMSHNITQHNTPDKTIPPIIRFLSTNRQISNRITQTRADLTNNEWLA